MSQIELFLSGDVMTGRGIDQILRHPGNPTLHEPSVRSAVRYVELAEGRNGPIPRSADPSYIWGDALEVLDRSSAAVRVVNLETAVTDRGEPWPQKRIHYRMHPDNLNAIAIGGIDCCVLANNHVLDWSHRGLAQTLDSLAGSDLSATGAGLDSSAAARPAVIPAGPDARVIVVGLGTSSSGIPPSWAAGDDLPGVAWTDSLSRARVQEIARSVASVARTGDLVVASIHWGPNWGYDIPAPHTRFARALIDQAGVHIVHGHSSHHPLGIEVYRDRPILYGCGDLINDYEGIGGHEEYHPDLGVLYFATLDPVADRLHRLELVPMRMRRFRLERPPSEEVEWLSHALNRASESLGTEIAPGEAGSLEVRW